MQKTLFLPPVALIAMFALGGCSPDSPSTEVKKTESTHEVTTVEDPQHPAAEKVRQANASRFDAEVRRLRRKGILKDLGPVDSWKVSTERDGKVDPELVEEEKRGDFDKTLKEAFSHLGLELKFFIHLPKAINGLKNLKPRPETCDLKCGEPVDFEIVKAKLGDDIKMTEDADPSGKPRKWYRDGQVSFGVVDNKITVVRLHLTARSYAWQELGTGR